MAPSRRSRWKDDAISAAVRARAKANAYPDLFAAGEPKAHVEIAKKHGVTFRCLGGSCAPAAASPRAKGDRISRAGGSRAACDPHNAYGAIFVVMAVRGKGLGGEGLGSEGAARAEHGVEMAGGEALDAWRASDAACKYVRNHRFTVDASDAPTARR